MRNLARPQSKLQPSFPSNSRCTGDSGILPGLLQPGAMIGAGGTGDSGFGTFVFELQAIHAGHGWIKPTTVPKVWTLSCDGQGN